MFIWSDGFLSLEKKLRMPPPELPLDGRAELLIL